MDDKKILELFSLRGTVAIITGAAGGLGINHAKILNDAGSTVISFDISKSTSLEGVAKQMIVDITNREEVFKAVDTIINKYGKVDVLINNAALNPQVEGESSKDSWAPHEEYPEELWKNEFDVGVHGAMWATQAVAKDMIKRNEGSIIFVSSVDALISQDYRKYKDGQFKSPAYPATKAALLGIMRTWAGYFAMQAPNVRSNALCLGGVDFGTMDKDFLKKFNDRNLLRRPANPDEYQGIILALASKATSFMTGSTIVIDGGQSAL